MTQVDAPAASGHTGGDTQHSPPAQPPPAHPLSATGAALAAVATVVVLAAVHLTQGTSTVGALDLLRLLLGADDAEAARVLAASRLPRMLAGVVVGLALGAAGAVLQSVARNPLASPDTLAVNAGAHLAVVATSVFGASLATGLGLAAGLGTGLLGGIAALGTALLGGLAGAALVLLLSAGGTAGPSRLILAGSAITLALHSLTMVLLLLYEEETKGLFAWGSGSLTQKDLTAVTQMAPVIAACLLGCLLVAHRLDLLALGDDPATLLGVRVRRTRVIAVVLAVGLSAAAVTVAGPIGFVGLCAPALVRLLGGIVPGLHRHRVLILLSALVGVLIVLGADVAVRGVFGPEAGVELPTGVATTIVGAAMLVWLARRHRDTGPTRPAPVARSAARRPRRFAALVTAATAALLCAAMVGGMLLGDTWVLLGDIANWLQGRTGTGLTFVLDQRYPRVLAAVLAGAALAAAGAVVQAVCRNPLAEPGLLGITAGAGVGAVALLTFVPSAGIWAMTGVAGVSALLVFALVYALAWRGGLNSDRLVLIGIGMWIGGMAVITLLVVVFDPWNTARALTWLSGSTYGRTTAQLLPVAVALAAVTPPLLLGHRALDLLALDDDTPRVLGVRLEAVRLAVLAGAALLTASAVAAVGVIGFVGLVAPHLARGLVGARHSRLLPLAILVGALVVSVADTVGRTVIAPAQIPAGLLTALVGTPYFVWLLWRARRAEA